MGTPGDEHTNVATTLAASLVGFPLTQPPPAELVGVVNGLYESGAHVVTLRDLAAADSGRCPRTVATTLRRHGWLEPSRTPGAWHVPFARGGLRVAGFEDLRARLAVHPGTPACVGGKSAAGVRGYLARPTRATIGFPPGVRLPRCLNEFTVARWAPRFPSEQVDGLPIWADETLLAFMAAKPAAMSWDDVAYWLPDVCGDIDAASLIAELAGRSRSVWMKAAYLAKRGGREDVADAVLARAPAGAGPYLFGHEERRRNIFAYRPEWHPRFEVMDYLLASWWLPKCGRQTP